MSSLNSTEQNAINQFVGQAEGDAKSAAAQDLPGIEADVAKAGNDMADDLDKAAGDVLGLAKDIGTKVFGDAKNDVAQFIDKLPQPLPYLLQGMAASSEAVLDSLGTQGYEQLSGEQKQLIEKMRKICGGALAVVEAFFQRKTA